MNGTIATNSQFGQGSVSAEPSPPVEGMLRARVGSKIQEPVFYFIFRSFDFDSLLFCLFFFGGRFNFLVGKQ